MGKMEAVLDGYAVQNLACRLTGASLRFPSKWRTGQLALPYVIVAVFGWLYSYDAIIIRTFVFPLC
jgi:hypothetical protein